MPRKGENVYKRRDGRWEARYIKFHDADGRIKYGYVYARTYKEAKIKRNEAILNNINNYTKENEVSDSFNNIAQNWLESEYINVKESSFGRYKRIVEKHLLPFFNDSRIDKITNKHLEEFINYLSENGRIDGKGGLSSKTIRDILTVLKSIFDYAKRSGISISCDYGNVNVKRRVNEVKVLTVSEQKILHDYLLQDIDLIKLGILMSLYTGIRIGELCALKWKNVDFTDGSLEICHTLQRIENNSKSGGKTKIVITEPKTRFSKRKIPLPDFIAEVMLPFSGKPEEYILTGDMDKYLEPRTVQDKFYKTTKACGLPKVNFHALRHTFATRSVELGFELKSLSEILGHSSVNITLEKYVHSSFVLKRNNMEKLAQIF